MPTIRLYFKNSKAFNYAGFRRLYGEYFSIISKDCFFNLVFGRTQINPIFKGNFSLFIYIHINVWV